LLSALNSEDLSVLAGAYAFFIRDEKPGTENMLIKALEEYGDRKMAADFIDSGKSQLEDAGFKWARKYGYHFLKTKHGTSLTEGNIDVIMLE
jgi:hypothetical protein